MDLFTLFGTISINASAANQTIDDTMEKVSDLGDALGGAGTSADTASGKFGETSKFNSACVWMGNMLTKVSEKAIDLVKSLGKIGFGFNTSIESYQYQFEALIGNADKASQLVADLQELAKISPLGLEGLANNTVTLLQAGIELSDIIPTIEMLGNLSLGDTDRMNSVVRAYTQILGKGGLMAQEMYQLGDAMVPIVEIMTKYGGERYADGSWYQAKMNDPTFKIPAEDMIKAFQAATAEGGKWHDYMHVIMDSFAGQYDRLGEEGKETLGALFKPFFDTTKTDIFPRLTEILETFRAWIEENQEPLSEFAKTLGDIATASFDTVLSFFSWCVENGDAIKAVFPVITAAIGGFIAKTHPYIAALAVVVGGLMKVIELQEDIEAGLAESGVDVEAFNADPFGYTWQLSQNQAKSGKTGLDLLAPVMQAMNDADPTLEVGVTPEDGAEAALQSDLDGMSLSTTVRVNPVLGAFQKLFDFYNLDGSGFGFENPDGVLASGLDRVPFDGYKAILHRDEAVLNRADAAAWRKQTGGFDSAELASSVAAAVRNAVAGIKFNVSLDSGALIGQLTPGIDAQLGTLANRKGRRNA